ncbi:hypothetical protein SRB5_67430 [Streptomyces sp. RB5]|uniref:Sulphur transport domain-containing protein n=1 Tax=Streptomyces smaragdinus TaxID=2585196 RepID=A0A7K0CV55_9ACTN|nr:YeeE/YedE thiosulfate transporter family protein [Streptomyces smaragdinus]MQY16544.1 hypothetical protein [Streptomyces smaragdinus]
MSDYWPWWAGAIGLAVVTVAYAVATDRSLGVSSAWDRVSHWRRERDTERMDDEFADTDALAAALAAATAEAFGPGPQAPPAYDAFGPYPAGPPRPQHAYAASAPAAPPVVTKRPAPLVTQAVLLISIFIGGVIAAVSSGRFEIRYDMGPGFEELVTGDPLTMVGLLFGGGVLVGFGTRLAGGCSSGHGLNGCGRMRPVSLVATAVFFGTAVVVSFLLWKVI